MFWRSTIMKITSNKNIKWKWMALSKADIYLFKTEQCVKSAQS